MMHIYGVSSWGLNIQINPDLVTLYQSGTATAWSTDRANRLEPMRVWMIDSTLFTTPSRLQFPASTLLMLGALLCSSTEPNKESSKLTRLLCIAWRLQNHLTNWSKSFQTKCFLNWVNQTIFQFMFSKDFEPDF